MSIWDLRCEAACPNRYESNVSIFETVQEMHSKGWSAQPNYNGEFHHVFCPEHSGRDADGFWAPLKWVVECEGFCDFYEEHETESDAKAAATSHNWSDCEWCEHSAHVLSPEDRREREERNRMYEKKRAQINLERDAEERYFAYLVNEDQKRRNMQGSQEAVSKEFYVVMALILATVITVLAIGLGAS